MRIYVDFDDCICETARAFTGIVERMFGITVPYEKVRFFNLKDSFGLTDREYEQLMIEGHRPEVLWSFEETPGASKVLNELIDMGHEVDVITGRPFSSYDDSRRWLDEHGLERIKLYCLDKYDRNKTFVKSEYNLSLDDYYRMKFDYAIEDSPLAFRFFEHMPELKVMIFDRPWNRDCEVANDKYMHCPDWEFIRAKICQ